MVAGLALAATLGYHAEPPEARVSARPRQVADGDYVSSATCQSCHPREHATWTASYHRTMTQVARPGTVAASFDGATVSAAYGRPMQLEVRGAELWASFDDPDSHLDPRQRSRIERQVVMTTGSHHQQLYWYATGKQRLLGQLPAVYLIDEQRWVPRRAAVLHAPTDPPFSETGDWNRTCIACHTTLGRPRIDPAPGEASLEQLNVDSEAAEFGIACEACHGPGGDHVRVNRDPLRRYRSHLGALLAPTTVQPARLPASRSSQVCEQCHGVWEFSDRDGERQANAHGVPYRPGAELRDSRFVAQPTINGESPMMRTLLADDAAFVRDSFWSDGAVRVSGREYNGLLESPCFRDAKSPSTALSCTSCHAMHQAADDPRPVAQWRNDQLGAGMDTNAACVQCHTALRGDAVTAHTKHGASSSGSECYNCHMPYTTYGLLKTIRSHTISSPSVEESLAVGRPNACNLCHLDQTLAWTASALTRDWARPPVSVDGDQREVAASLLWLLKGDAGQRAIVADAFGRPAARAASGTDWMAPYLAQLLEDPYDAVRFAAARSLNTLPGLTGLNADFLVAPERRRPLQLQTMAAWDRSRARRRSEARLLMTPGGDVDAGRVIALLRQRDTRRMLLRE